MRNVSVIRVYNLVDSKGNKLRLRLGMLSSCRDDVCISSADKGYRWSFVGEHIPMPVRSMTWFNGFKEDIMLSWLKGNGWYVCSCVNMDTGVTRVYELPKGNETSIDDYNADKLAFDKVIRDLVHNGKRISAVHTYRYAHGGTLRDAYYAIKEICGLD